MPVIYNGKKIIPAPMASISKVYDTTGDGRHINPRFNITLEGRLVVDKGSPNSGGAFWTSSGYPPDEIIDQDSWLTSIIRKQEGLRELFATEGKLLEIQGYDGDAPLKCNPRIKGPLEFQRGSPTSWAQHCDYRITFEADIIYGIVSPDGEDEDDLLNYHIENTNQQWNIEAADDNQRTFRLTRSLSAKGKRFYQIDGTLMKPAWENARDYVLNKLVLGLDVSKMVASGVLNNDDFQSYNYVRKQSVGEFDGTFGVEEAWLCFNPGSGAHAIDEYNVSIKNSENGLSEVDVDGTIRGLEQRDDSYAVLSTKWSNAQAKWNEVRPNLVTRVRSITGNPYINSTPLSSQVGYNDINGVITYRYNYNTRATPRVSGAISESINLVFDNQADVFARIPVLGRVSGPVLQAIGTVTEKRQSLIIEAVMPASNGSGYTSPPNTNPLLLYYLPIFTSKLFKAKDTENWNDITGRYSRQVEWVYE